MKYVKIKAILLVPIVFLLLIQFLSLPAEAKEEEDIGQIIATMKKAIIEKNDPMRNRMYFKLRIIGKPAVKPLVETLNDQEPGVSEYAAFVLGWIADPKGIEPLKDFLRKGTSTQKKAALQALGNMAWGTDESIRTEVHKNAVGEMLKYLENDDPVVQREAAYGLGLAGDPKAIPVLQKYVEAKDELLRFFAKEAIERIENTLKGF